MKRRYSIIIVLVCMAVSVMVECKINSAAQSYRDISTGITDGPATDTTRSVKQGTTYKNLNSGDYTDHQGDMVDLYYHCGQMARAGGVGGGNGATGCNAGEGRCIFYSTCKFNLRVEDQIGTGHIDLGSAVAFFEPTRIDWNGGSEIVEAGLVRKNAMVRACPITEVRSEYYTDGDNPRCTYLYYNSDRADIIYLPFHMLAGEWTFTPEELPSSLEWQRRFSVSGVAGVESYRAESLLNQVGLKAEEKCVKMLADFSLLIPEMINTPPSLVGINATLQNIGKKIKCESFYDEGIMQWTFCGAGRHLIIVCVIGVGVILLGVVLTLLGLLLRCLKRIVDDRRNGVYGRKNDDAGMDI